MKKKGFTLIELIVVVFVIILLAGGGIYAYSKYVYNQKERITKANLAIILETLERYKEKTGTYPQTQAEFDTFLENKEWFKEIPINVLYGTSPTNPKYGWLYIINNNVVEIYALQK